MFPIEGARYHCQVCADFDFCQACFEKGESHGHAFERFDDQGQPAVFVGSPKAKSKNFVVTMNSRMSQNGLIFFLALQAP